MYKIISVFSVVSVYIILNFAFTENLYSTVPSEQTEYVKGKVVYSGSNIPVNGGKIKVYKFSQDGDKEITLENTIIQTDGTFRINRENIHHTADGIKIMAYPNDYENLINSFEPKELDLQKSLQNSEKEFEIIISVEKKNTIQQQGLKSIDEQLITDVRNFPNPFNPSTLIRFNLPNSSLVSLKIFNLKGESVAVLAENLYMNKGYNELNFNASNLPSGTYVYNLHAGDIFQTGKMTLIK